MKIQKYYFICYKSCDFLSELLLYIPYIIIIKQIHLFNNNE